MLRALAAVAVAAVIVPPATASDHTGFAFGRMGGSIRPFTVVIDVDGVVHSSGPVHTRSTRVPRLQLGKLNQLAVQVGFAKLDRTTACPGVLPDTATTFIRVGRQTARVHGTCVASYQRLWKALSRAARLAY